MKAARSALPVSQPAEERLSTADFQRVAQFVTSATGIKLPPAKKVMVEGRLRRRMRALGLASLHEYCELVFDSGTCDDEVVNLIDAVTTNKTDFFREPTHFTFLNKTVLPLLYQEGHAVKMWSAASSIGAEPYTLAMVLSDFAAAHPGFRFSIMASDISTEVLSQAARAIYAEDMIEPVPLAMRERYVLRSIDPARRLVRMAPEIRAQVRFLRINLMDARYPVDRDMDVIFCRNILIYFDKPTQEMVVRRLCQHLRPGGFLMLGHSDSIAGLSIPLKSYGHSIFRRE